MLKNSRYFMFMLLKVAFKFTCATNLCLTIIFISKGLFSKIYIHQYFNMRFGIRAKAFNFKNMVDFKIEGSFFRYTLYTV